MSGISIPSGESLAAIRRAVSSMATHATERVERDHPWFSDLPAQERSWIGVIAQGGIVSFLRWIEAPSLDREGALDVFADAPRELTRSISLEQTLDLLRTVIAVVEDEAPAHARTDEQPAVREAVLHYSREVAFAAAHVYARAAESRGAWDARLESLVVEALVRGEPDDSLGARASALGWAHVRGVTVAVGTSPRGDESRVIDPLRRAARHAGLDLLVSVEGRRMIVVVGGIEDDPLEAVAALADHFGPGPLVCGPQVPHLYAAGRSARDALRGFDAAPAVPQSPRPVNSSDLLAARAIAGDDKARRHLAHLGNQTLSADSPLGQTARAYLRLGSLEATARDLFVHANTVRYRIGKIADATGYDLAVPDDAFALRLAIMLADLDIGRASRRPRIDDSL